MKAFNGYDEAKVRKGSFETLPKDAYICKVLNVRQVENKNGGERFDIMFDIAEGDYKDFYQTQFKKNKENNEDAKYPNDGIFRLNIPDDSSEDWMKDNFKTFVNALEESNSGYHWDWDESKWKNKIFGGLFHIEQSEYKGKIYDHTRLRFVRAADDVRNKTYGSLPNDKLVDNGSVSVASATDDLDSFANVPEGTADEIPFD